MQYKKKTKEKERITVLTAMRAKIYSYATPIQIKSVSVAKYTKVLKNSNNYQPSQHVRGYFPHLRPNNAGTTEKKREKLLDDPCQVMFACTCVEKFCTGRCW